MFFGRDGLEGSNGRIEPSGAPIRKSLFSVETLDPWMEGEVGMDLKTFWEAGMNLKDRFGGWDGSKDLLGGWDGFGNGL